MDKLLIVLAVCTLLASCSALPRLQPKIQSGRIVGGAGAVQGQFPYHIGIYYQSASPTWYVCGGALAEVKGVQVVITAAHCVDELGPSSFVVVGGDLNISDSSGHEQTRRVSRKIVHENYDYRDFSNNIAFLVPTSPFELNNNLSPVALPTQGKRTTGDVVISGWGSAYLAGDFVYYLRHVRIPSIDDATCQEAYPDKIIADNMLCTGLAGDDKGTCYGDEGSPVRSVIGNYLAGVVSWLSCPDATNTSINTEVSHFINWLEEKV